MDQTIWFRLRTLVQFWQTSSDLFSLRSLWAQEIPRKGLSELYARTNGGPYGSEESELRTQTGIHGVKAGRFYECCAVKMLIGWPYEKNLEARTKFVEFRKRDNDELGLDNIFANYEDKNWG